MCLESILPVQTQHHHHLVQHLARDGSCVAQSTHALLRQRRREQLCVTPAAGGYSDGGEVAHEGVDSRGIAADEKRRLAQEIGAGTQEGGDLLVLVRAVQVEEDLRLADARVLVALCALRCVRDPTQIMEDNGEVVPARETIA